MHPVTEPFNVVLSRSECVDLVRILTNRASEIHAAISACLKSQLNSEGFLCKFDQSDEALVDLWAAESLTALARATMEAYAAEKPPRIVEYVTRREVETITLTRNGDAATITVPCNIHHSTGIHLQPFIARAYAGGAFS
jgi:hypothetical protein